MSNIDVTQSLKDTENALRDFIASILANALGPDWLDTCGVHPKRREAWLKNRQIETERQAGGAVEPRLIYYAGFGDLELIIEKNWDHFAPALGDLPTIKMYLRELKKLRDPDAHRRELLPHQKHLALGIGGEIRTRLIRYRSQAETAEAYFPRIESVRDSLGNTHIGGSGPGLHAVQLLRPGDLIDYVITASDPLGDSLSYRARINLLEFTDWQREHTVSVQVRETDVGKSFWVQLQIKSPRDYHAQSGMDDGVEFQYTVLPSSRA